MLVRSSFIPTVGLVRGGGGINKWTFYDVGPKWASLHERTAATTTTKVWYASGCRNTIPSNTMHLWIISQGWNELNGCSGWKTGCVCLSVDAIIEIHLQNKRTKNLGEKHKRIVSFQSIHTMVSPIYKNSRNSMLRRGGVSYWIKLDLLSFIFAGSHFFLRKTFIHVYYQNHLCLLTWLTDLTSSKKYDVILWFPVCPSHLSESI